MRSLFHSISTLWVPLMVVVGFVGGAPPVAAEPIAIRILGGSLELIDDTGDLAIVGERGFALISNVAAPAGVFDPWSSCTPCMPGAEIPLRAHWDGSDLPGFATLDGQTYTGLGGSGPFDPSASVSFAGSPVVAPPLDDAATLMAPFTFSGTFSYVPQGELLHRTELLSGQGIATIQLRRHAAEDVWMFQRAVYRFDPVPEPATLLLFGTGVALGALRSARTRRVRRRAPSSLTAPRT